jgi:hypothetical protein
VGVGVGIGSKGVRAIGPSEVVRRSYRPTCGCYLGGMSLSRRTHTRITGTLCNSACMDDQQPPGPHDCWNFEIDMRVAAPAVITAIAGIGTVNHGSALPVGNLIAVSPSSIVTLGRVSSPQLFGTRGVSLYSAVHLIDNANPSVSGETSRQDLR